MNCQQLTEFQYLSLLDCANLEADTYMLILPHPLDPRDQRERWAQNNLESDQLVEMGLVRDISDQHTKQIEKEFSKSGRIFRVFQITDLGRSMFDERNSASSLPQ